jgi:hypothetical protein
MEEKEINNLIDKKILEAKLDIADKRFKLLILIASGLLTLFGLIFPFWLSISSNDRVDKAITEMKSDVRYLTTDNNKFIERISNDIKTQLKDVSLAQNNYENTSTSKIDKGIQSMDSKFKELAGTALRKPKLICLYKGNSIESSTITFDNKGNFNCTIELKDIGDAKANNIHIKLYIKSTKDIIFQGGMYFNGISSDEPNYDKVYDITNADVTSIDSKDSKPDTFEFQTDINESLTIPAMLKIYYEQPEPIVYHFTIKYKFN